MRETYRIDFVISNPGHHLEMSLAVVARLKEDRRFRCRLLSMCELRGKASPAVAPEVEGASLRRMVPRLLRRPEAVDRTLANPERRAAGERLRSWTWRLVLAPGFRRCLREGTDLVVLPNDAAFPYDRLSALLRRQGVPFLLMQEGIRFPLPAEEENLIYGAGGAAAIAAWGETSSRRFRRVGVAEERIRRTGSPRFDALRPEAWDHEAAEIRHRLGLGEKNLLLLTNPIDAQGFCSQQEKVALVARFASALGPLYEKGWRLLIKTHGGEDPEEFGAALASASGARVRVLGAEPLYGLFRLSAAAVVLASTVGLEAQLFGLPLGVLEIPGTGFVHDYVDSGSALGLGWDRPMAPQVEELLGPWGEASREAVERYLEQSLTGRAGSAGRVAGLVRELVGASP